MLWDCIILIYEMLPFILQLLIRSLYQNAGWTADEIHDCLKWVTDISVRSIRRLGMASERPRAKRGRAAYFDRYNRRARLLKTLAAALDDTSTAVEITTAYLQRVGKFNTSRRTINRELNRLGIKWRNPKNFKDLTPEQRHHRKSFSETYRGWRLQDWWAPNVLILDEKKFDGSRTRGQRLLNARAKVRKIFCKKGTAHKHHMPRKNTQMNRTPYRILGGFTSEGVILWRRYRRLESRFYAKAVVDALPNGGVVVCDNHSVHKSQYTQSTLLRHGIASIYLPVNSPDLSSMDYSVWTDIGSRMIERENRMRPTTTESEMQYQRRLAKTAKDTDLHFLRKVVTNLFTRFEKCIAAGGDVFQE